MKPYVLLLVVISLLCALSSHAARAPVYFSLVAQNTSTPSNVQLALSTEILKETYCDGPDPDFLTLRILLGLSFQNLGNRRVILQRGSKSTASVKVSKSVEDALANRFETTIDISTITNGHSRSARAKKPPLTSFVMLSPGESYKTITEFSLPVPRDKPLPVGVSPGTHYLQVEIWTWDEPQSEAIFTRRLWEKEGFLWSNALLSKPMPFTVQARPQGENCNCPSVRVGRLAAIEIAHQKMKALGRPVQSADGVAVSQACEWQIVLAAKDPNSPASIFIIDKVTGKVLAEFQ